MPRVFIPLALRDRTQGVSEVDVDGASVRALINNLDRLYPGLREKLCTDDALVSGLSVSIDGNIAGLGLYQKVPPTAEVHFIPAIGGG